MGHSCFRISLSMFLLLSACGDTTTVDGQSDLCGGCPAGQICDPFTRACIGGGSTDMGDDAVTDGTDDPQNDGAGSGDAEPDRASNDPGLEDIVDRGDPSEEEDPFADEDRSASEDLVDADRDTDDGGDASCVDSFENHTVGDDSYTENNFWHRASELHGSLLLAQLGACTGRVAWDEACVSTCELDLDECTTLTRGLCGCCECGLYERLVLCGPDDRDNYTFTLLRGETASIRMRPLWSRAPADFREEFVVFVWQPPEDHPRTDPLPPAGEAIRGEWDATGAFVELEIGSAYVGDSTGALASYVMTIAPSNPAMEPFEYELIFQVGDSSRGCPADPWDGDWETYSTNDPSETGCAIATDCVLVHGVAKEGTICPWDQSDLFRITISEAADHKVRVNHQVGAPDLTAEVLTVGGDPVRTICSESGACRQATYFEEVLSLDAGDYLIRVAGDGDFSHNAYAIEVIEP